MRFISSNAPESFSEKLGILYFLAFRGKDLRRKLGDGDGVSKSEPLCPELSRDYSRTRWDSCACSSRATENKGFLHVFRLAPVRVCAQLLLELCFILCTYL